MLISLSKESTKITYSATSFGFKNVLKSWSVEIFPISVFVEDGEDPMLILDENNKDKELRSRTLIGSNILYDIDKKPDSKRTFTGKIYNPEEGKSYKSKIRQLDNGNLEIKGCFAVVCRKVGEWLPLNVTINDEGKRIATLANPLAIF